MYNDNDFSRSAYDAQRIAKNLEREKGAGKSGI